MECTPEAAFWSFSCSLYQCPKVEPALLRLERRHHLNVNVLLFCAWAGVSGLQQLRAEQIGALINRIDLWHERVVLPLRRLQRAMKKRKVSAELYAHVCEEALSAERMEQGLMLAQFARFKQIQTGGVQRRMHRVCHNIAVYFEAGGMPFGARQQGDVLVMMQALFDQVPADKVAQRCLAIWTKHLPKRRPQQMTFSLPLRSA